MIKEAIILAGGLGTRLKEAVPDLPKCMAPILAKPFIGYLVDYLQQQGIEKFIFSLGYKSNIVEQYLNTQYSHLNLVFSVETAPLGTGGAIKLACKHVAGKTVMVLNGDTFFYADIQQLASFHNIRESECTLALKPMKNIERYGLVEIDSDNCIQSFKEKQYYKEGLINGGVYTLQVANFLQKELPDSFSFEKDFLERFVIASTFYGLIQDKYFIDIGIPEDFERAQTELILNTHSND